MDSATALHLAGSDPDYHVKDLFNAIKNKDYPSWTISIQVMTPEQAKVAPIDIFDDTYTWPHEAYPLRRVGRMTLTGNVGNHTCDRQQMTNSSSRTTTSKTLNKPASHLQTWCPELGLQLIQVQFIIAFSDPNLNLTVYNTVLQARMFSYPDAHRYRVGPNYFQLPPNRPINKVYAPYVRDGPGTMNGNYGPDPDYLYSELRPMKLSKRVRIPTHETYSGHVTAFSTSLKDKDFEQPRALWHIICQEKGGKEQFLQNITPTLADIPEKLQQQVLSK